MQYVKTELSYDGDLLHVTRHPVKNKLISFNSLVLEFWAKNLSVTQIARFFYRLLTPEQLDLLTSFF